MFTEHKKKFNLTNTQGNANGNNNTVHYQNGN